MNALSCDSVWQERLQLVTMCWIDKSGADWLEECVQCEGCLKYVLKLNACFLLNILSFPTLCDLADIRVSESELGGPWGKAPLGWHF